MDTLDGYTFSMVSTEYLDPHFYCYKEGLPELMVALDFWRWQDDERCGIPENVMLDGEIRCPERKVPTPAASYFMSHLPKCLLPTLSITLI